MTAVNKRGPAAGGDRRFQSLNLIAFTGLLLLSCAATAQPPGEAGRVVKTMHAVPDHLVGYARAELREITGSAAPAEFVTRRTVRRT